MINILTNKLSESKDNNIVWKNNNPVLYQKYCQYIQKEENVQKKCNLVPKVLNVIPVSVDRTNKVELVNTTIPAVRVHDIIPVDIVNPNIPVDKSRDSILEDFLVFVLKLQIQLDGDVGEERLRQEPVGSFDQQIVD